MVSFLVLVVFLFLCHEPPALWQATHDAYFYANSLPTPVGRENLPNCHFVRFLYWKSVSYDLLFVSRKNALAFGLKRRSVFSKTYLRFTSNALAFWLKRTCVCGRMYLRFFGPFSTLEVTRRMSCYSLGEAGGEEIGTVEITGEKCGLSDIFRTFV